MDRRLLRSVTLQFARLLRDHRFKESYILLQRDSPFAFAASS
jgi:hypothetical protein